MVASLKSLFKWTLIVLASVVVLICLWMYFIWSGTDEHFVGDLASLVPAQALALTRLDQAGKNIPLAAQHIQTSFEESRDFEALEASPLWQSFFNPDPPEVYGSPKDRDFPPRREVLTIQQLREKIVAHGIHEVQKFLAALPIGLELEDLLGDETVIATLCDMNSKKLRPLIYSRVSRSLILQWRFRGFAEGEHGSATVETSDETLVVTQELPDGSQGARYFALFEDVLVIATRQADIDAVAALHEGEGKSFSGHPQYSSATAQIAKSRVARKTAWVSVYLDLNVLRSLMGTEPVDPARPNSPVRSRFDGLLSIPPSFKQLSVDIVPAVEKIFTASLDTTLFTLAAWSIDIGESHKVWVDQFLMIDGERLKTNPHLETSWSMDPARMALLDLLPADTWLIASNRLAFASMREALKEELARSAPVRRNRDDEEVPNFVASFLDHLGPSPAITSIGFACFGPRYEPTPGTPDAEKWAPQGALIKVPFPAFALVMEWNGITHEQVLKIAEAQLASLDAKALGVKVVTTAQGDKYVAFERKTPADKEMNAWYTNLAFAAIGDHLMLVYSNNNSAVTDMFAIQHGNTRLALRSATNAPWSELSQVHSTLLYLDPDGFARYADRANLSKELAKARYSSTRPYGKDLATWRREKLVEGLSEERIANFFDGPQGLKKSWMALAQPYEQKLRQNFDACAGAINDFSAQTIASAKQRYVHTSMLLRVK